MLYLYLALSFGAVLLFARKPLQCPLIFLGAFLGLLLLHALVLAAASLFVNKKKPDPKHFPFFRKLLTVSIGPLLQLGAVKVELVGADRLPAGGFLLVGPSYEKDCSLDAFMAELRLREETNVARILFT